MTLQETMDRAMDLHRAGQLAEAERLYRQVLQVQPDAADALHLLGVIAGQAGRGEAALDLIRRAIAIKPREAVYHGNLAFTLDRLGRIDEALASFETAAKLGTDDPGIINNHADALRKKGRVNDSISMLKQLIARNPDFPDARNNLGLALASLDRYDDAIAEYRHAIRLAPKLAEAHNNLGNALLKKKRFKEAIAEFELALSCRPDYANAMMNLGAALKAVNEHDRALALFRRALQLQPDFFEALVNLGQALCDIHQFDDAIATYRRAISLRPDDPAAHFHLSGVLLLTGNFQDGWREYEWRLLNKDFPLHGITFPQPRWKGEDLAGKRIFLHAEQGAGDLLQYSRLAPELTRRGAEVVLGCPASLTRLMRSLQGISRLVTESPGKSECDYHCYLLSLPLMLGLRPNAIPAQVPYLRSEPALVEKWKTRLSPIRGKKIGLVWAGNPLHTNDHNRSIALAEFAPLAAIEGVTFVSLQKGETANATPPAGLHLIDLTPELTDYAETAALIANLDLVISADTSVAHLAGAMGKPVWMLLPYHPDLRWLLNRSDSPWYPTMRLFRQPRPSDWKSTITAVANALRELK